MAITHLCTNVVPLILKGRWGGGKLRLFAKVSSRKMSCLTACRLPGSLDQRSAKTLIYDFTYSFRALIKKERKTGKKTVNILTNITIQKENLKSKSKQFRFEKCLLFGVTLIQAVMYKTICLQNIRILFVCKIPPVL